MPCAASCPTSRNGDKRIDQRADALARQQLSARKMPFSRLRTAAFAHLVGHLAQIRDKRLHRLCVGGKLRRRGIERGVQRGHWASVVCRRKARGLCPLHPH
jgi:hypothetical protein